MFGVNISGIINSAMGPLLVDLSIDQSTPGTRTGSTGGTNPTTAASTGKGFVEDRGVGGRFADGTSVTETTRVVSVLGDGISPAIVPGPGDRVTIGGTTYTVARVLTDPAQALYDLVVN